MKGMRKAGIKMNLDNCASLAASIMESQRTIQQLQGEVRCQQQTLLNEVINSGHYDFLKVDMAKFQKYLRFR